MTNYSLVLRSENAPSDAGLSLTKITPQSDLRSHPAIHLADPVLPHDQPASLFADDAFFLHLCEQAAEMLTRDGDHLGYLALSHGELEAYFLARRIGFLC